MLATGEANVKGLQIGALFDSSSLTAIHKCDP